VVAPPGVVARQSHEVVPYAHIVPAAVSQVAPGVGCVAGQGAAHSQRMPPPPAGPAKPMQVQLVPS
jgi:hypothetical protein